MSQLIWRAPDVSARLANRDVSARLGNRDVSATLRNNQVNGQLAESRCQRHPDTK
ncbi:MAG: hypothetical protein U0103_29030 [Candidatus Obscuribacterales bacterium]